MILILLVLSQSLFAQTVLRYEGYLENSGSPVDALSQNFNVSIMKPGCATPLMATTATADIVAGEFNIAPSFTDSNLFSERMNPNYIFGAGACAVAGPAREMQIVWSGQTFNVAINDAVRASFANRSALLGARSESEFLRIVTNTGYSPLSTAQVSTLLDLVSGNYLNSSSAFAGDVTGSSGATVVSRIRGVNVVATAPTLNQVLKFDGTNYVPSTDATGASGPAGYGTAGLVSVLTNQTVSGLTIDAAGLLSMPNLGTPGTYGSNSQVPVFTTDTKGRVTGVVNTTIDDSTKLPLVGGTLTGPLTIGASNISNVGFSGTSFRGRSLIVDDDDSSNNATLRVPSSLATNYTLTLPPNVGAAGEVLTTNGAGVLSWTAPIGGGSDVTALPFNYITTLNNYNISVGIQTESKTGIGFYGRILRADGTPVSSATTEFRIRIKSPGSEGCLLYEEFQTKNLTLSSGTFSINVGDTDEPSRVPINITNPLTASPFTLTQVFSNRFPFVSGLNCDDASGTYTPASNHGRVMAIQFRESAIDIWESVPNLPFNALTYGSQSLEGFRANEFLKIDPLATYPTLTPGNVNSLIDLVTGASNLYLRPTTAFSGDVSGTFNTTTVIRLRGRELSTAVPNTGDVLTYNGAQWIPQPQVATGVTNVTSTNSYLTVASGSTIPTLTLNVGTASNMVAAGDDVRIVGALQSSDYNADVIPAASCTPSQTSYWNTVSGTWACQSININIGGIPLINGLGLDINGSITQRGMTAPAVSPAGQGRIYFDFISNKFRVSENGGAYVDLLPTATPQGVRFPTSDTIGASIAIGDNALDGQTVPAIYSNIAIGYLSMSSPLSSTADENVAVGRQTLAAVSSGFQNTAIGTRSMLTNTSGSQNTSLGFESGQFLVGSGNTALGNRTLESTAGDANSAVGSNSLRYVDNGDFNTGIGADSGLNLINGSRNTFLGFAAGSSAAGGNNNVFIGNEVGGSVPSTGSNNILIGTNDLVVLPSASTNNHLNIGNLLFGVLSPANEKKLKIDGGLVLNGRPNADVNSNISSTNEANLFYDQDLNRVRVSTNSSVFADVLVSNPPEPAPNFISGNSGSATSPVFRGPSSANTGIYFPPSNTIAFSNSGTESMVLDPGGNVGIGISSPLARLHVNGPVRIGNTGTNISAIRVCSSPAISNSPAVFINCSGNTTSSTCNCQWHIPPAQPITYVEPTGSGVTVNFPANAMGVPANAIRCVCYN